MSIDLSQMSLAELQRLGKRVERAIAGHEKKRVKEARNAMQKLAKEYGVTLEQLLADGAPKKRGRPAGGGKAGGKPKAKGKPKFANPKDKSQTWTGKGRKPQWFIDAMASGKREKDLAI